MPARTLFVGGCGSVVDVDDGEIHRRNEIHTRTNFIYAKKYMKMIMYMYMYINVIKYCQFEVR